MNKNSVMLFIVLIITSLILSISNVKAQETLFEKIGHYSIITAGSNLAQRESYFGAGDQKLIIDSKWNTLKNIIPSNIANRVNNITGSNLKLNGNTKKAYLGVVDGKNDMSIAEHSEVLIIDPDGNYKVYKYNRDSQTDITDFVKKSGWYYVSILDADNMPQQAWSMTVVYENLQLPLSYVKLIDANSLLSGETNRTDTDGTTLTTKLNSKLNYRDYIKIMGVIYFAGGNAYHESDDFGAQYNYLKLYYKDRAWAILDDNSEYQLYDRGDGHFTGRTITDFANGTYSTQRSTDLKGGELDIFEEQLTPAYFGGKHIIGLKFQKDGKNLYQIRLVGFSLEIESPSIKIIPQLQQENDDVIKHTVIVENTSIYNACNSVVTIPIDSNIKNVRDVVLSKTDGVSYKVDDNNIVITFSRQFKSKENLTVTYKADKKDSNTKVVYLKPEMSVYPASGDECPAEITSNSNLKITTKGETELPIPTKQYAKDTPSGKNGAAVKEGNKIKYNISYMNPYSEAKTISIVDKLSNGLKYVEGSAKIGSTTKEPDSIQTNSDGSTTILWTRQLDSDVNEELTYTVLVTGDVDRVHNKAIVKYGDGPEIEIPELSNPLQPDNVIDVPNTASTIAIIGVIGGLALVGGSGYLIYRKYRKA